MRSIALRRAATLIAIATLVAVCLMLVAACGGSDVTGTYKYDSGTEKSMADVKLTLNDDDSFVLAMPNPAGGEDVSIKGTYTLDGDKITLKTTGSDSESEAGKVEGDKLVFGEEVTWVKE